MILFEYGKTELPDGFYVVGVTERGETESLVAEYCFGSWYMCGVEYDRWQFGQGTPPVLHVIARVHLDKGVASMELL